MDNTLKISENMSRFGNKNSLVKWITVLKNLCGRNGEYETINLNKYRSTTTGEVVVLDKISAEYLDFLYESKTFIKTGDKTFKINPNISLKSVMQIYNSVFEKVEKPRQFRYGSLVLISAGGLSTERLKHQGVIRLVGNSKDAFYQESLLSGVIPTDLYTVVQCPDAKLKGKRVLPIEIGFEVVA